MNRLAVFSGFLCILLVPLSEAQANHYTVKVTLKSLKCLTLPVNEGGELELETLVWVGCFGRDGKSLGSKYLRDGKKPLSVLRRGRSRIFNDSVTFTLSESDYLAGQLSISSKLWEHDKLFTGKVRKEDLGYKQTKVKIRGSFKVTREIVHSKGSKSAELEMEIRVTPPQTAVKPKPLPYEDVFGQWQMGKIRLSFTKSGRWFMSNPEDANNNYAGPFKYVSKSGNIIKLDLVVSSGSSAGHTLKAIFRRDGNNLEYCGSYKARPTQFKQGGGSVYWIFRQR